MASAWLQACFRIGISHCDWLSAHSAFRPALKAAVKPHAIHGELCNGQNIWGGALPDDTLQI